MMNHHEKKEADKCYHIENVMWYDCGRDSYPKHQIQTSTDFVNNGQIPTLIIKHDDIYM